MMPEIVEFVGLKKHTHDDRAKIIRDRIVPVLTQELGDNLIAIAADGSYARNEDAEYSDLEFMIFVKDKKDLPFGFSRIIDGMLIEGIYITEDEYYRTVIEPNPEWFISGSDTLYAITNPQYIEKIKRYTVEDLKEKCRACVDEMLPEMQESFAKLFMAIDRKNIENIFPILFYALHSVLKLMAFINRIPYKTLGSFITQSRMFKNKPAGFDDFLDVIVDGTYRDLPLLKQRSTVLFAGIEAYLEKAAKAPLYDSDLSTITKRK